MELKQYLSPLQKWWWLLILSTLVSATSSFIATRFQPPIYKTHTALMIGQAIENANPNSLDIYLTSQLAQSYIEIAKRRPVQEGTMTTLGLTWLPEYTVSQVPNTQVLEIAVTDSSPERAQAVANTLAQQLILQSPTGAESQDQERQEFINQQLDRLQIEITDTDAEITNLQTQLGDMVSARQIADTQTQIAGLQSKLNTLQTNYATLLSNTSQGAVNSLQVIETAPLPIVPIGPNKPLTILTGAAIGFVLAAAAAYLMEYLDDTLKTPEEISNVLEAPVIGYIAETLSAADEDSILVVRQPRSSIAEAYRTLRTNLEFAGVDRPLRTILITSASPSDGKTTIASNLAAIIAQGGKRVILLDADLRRPRVHRLTALTNRFGLSDVFRDQMSLDGVRQPISGIENLSVITSGSLPPNPAELLKSGRMDTILSDLQQLADMVIIDSPPFLVSDPSVLATKVDGVLLVTRPGQTNAETLKAVHQQFNRVGARILGVVLNRIPHRTGFYYGGYRYYYAPYYYSSHYGLDDATSGPTPRKRGLFAFFSRWRAPRPTPETPAE